MLEAHSRTSLERLYSTYTPSSNLQFHDTVKPQAFYVSSGVNHNFLMFVKTNFRKVRSALRPKNFPNFAFFMKINSVRKFIILQSSQ